MRKAMVDIPVVKLGKMLTGKFVDLHRVRTQNMERIKVRLFGS
jgi:hypothetical protein